MGDQGNQKRGPGPHIKKWQTPTPQCTFNSCFWRKARLETNLKLLLMKGICLSTRIGLDVGANAPCKIIFVIISANTIGLRPLYNKTAHPKPKRTDTQIAF